MFGDDKVRIRDKSGKEVEMYVSSMEFGYEGDKRKQLEKVVMEIK